MRQRSAREPFVARKIRLAGTAQVAAAQKLLANAPIDPARPLELVLREEVKARKPDQNSLMWAGPLRDISEQVWLEGRKYSPEVWHEQFKRSFLPEEFDPELCKEGYLKWDYTPAGDRVLIGSTTQLTVKGMAQYIEQIHAFGAEFDVQFHASPNEVRA
jgi:hypothetical protein